MKTVRTHEMNLGDIYLLLFIFRYDKIWNLCIT